MSWHGLQIFVVAGGWDGSVQLSSTETLTVGSSSWMSGEALPWAIAYSTSLSLEHEILLFGTYSMFINDMLTIPIFCRRLFYQKTCRNHVL